ncbi:MAG TPA: hypothetical protein ENJ38_12210 [Rhodospirillales bacterium]|nr:hypothetical protein [Rhodospirillales bacterium]
MNRHDLHVLHLARLVLEARTALSVSTGLSEGTFDTQLVRDANGLPALPATSIAGVLRHLWIDAHGEASAQALFGYQDKKAGQTSRLAVSWGALLDSRGRPAEGLLIGNEGGERLKDPLYESVLLQADVPVTRDRVRLTHRGAAADRGKFDRSVLPAGHRFALELRLWSENKDDEDWMRLLALFHHPLFRLGGATRAGLGAMALVSCHARSFDLRDREESQAFRALPHGLADREGLEDITGAAKAHGRHEGLRQGALRLRARGFWRIGEGEEPLINRDAQGRPLKAADLLPRIEEAVTWKPTEDGKRTIRLCLLPGSSLKGALAHRMAFHYRRLSSAWAEEQTGGPDDARPAALDALLGAVKNGDEEAAGKGCAGALFIDDTGIEADTGQVARLMHNAIDRFTGGVRDRVLYEEESLFGGEIEVRITLDTHRFEKNLKLLGLQDEAETRRIRDAFRLTLDDLCQGRLALGSRTTTGNGFFDGGLEGELRDWLDGRMETQEEAAA